MPSKSGWIVFFCLVVVGSKHLAAQGLIVSAAGPVNRSMGGASTAAPLDAIGAIYWNPATITQLPSNEIGLGLDLLFANQEVRSSFGPFAGETKSDTGAFPIPNFGWVHKTSNPYITFGLGLNSVAGFKTNLNADPTNPILAPPPFGLGLVSSEASFMQFAPVGAFQLTDTLSVAVGPTITTGQVGVQPFVFDSPNANGYPSGRATRYHWGAGFQLGAFYKPNLCWKYGVSLKSPTWMETFEFESTDANGGPRQLTAELDLPLILSLGTAYTGFERWLFALDVRYLDYGNTQGLGDPAEFNGTGKLMGLGWNSVLATAMGAQFQWNDRLSLRTGYSFNQNPVSNSESFFNVATPLIYQHMVSTGGSWLLSESTACHLAYSYMFENTRTGPLYAPGIGAIPGSSVDNTLDAQVLSFGVSLRH